MANSKHCVNMSTTKLTLTILDLAQIFQHKAWRREKRNVFAVISFCLAFFFFGLGQQIVFVNLYIRSQVSLKCCFDHKHSGLFVWR